MSPPASTTHRKTTTNLDQIDQSFEYEIGRQEQKASDNSDDNKILNDNNNNNSITSTDRFLRDQKIESLINLVKGTSARRLKAFLD